MNSNYSFKKKKLAIIGASYLQLPLIKKANELGIETHVFAWIDGAVGKEISNFFYPISIVEKEKILDKCKSIGIDGIISIASDLATITVNYVANKLGLIGNSPKCTEISTNKYKMRNAFLKNGLTSPRFKLHTPLDTYEIEKLSLPLIVKPTDRSGSRGVTKIERFISLPDAITRAKKESLINEVIIEEYIEGKEISVEFLSFKGEHTF